MSRILTNKWFKLGCVLFVYLLWTLWIGSWWLLLGVPVLFDIYITKKVHWAFWKKKGVEKQTKTVEWIDALIFAIIAATLIRMFFFEAYTIPTSSMEKSMLVGDYLFVSKVAYGPKLPNTPLSVPFTHHTLPFTQSTKAYSDLIQWPYKRIAGLGEIKREDIVVFNFPAGDTVVVGRENPDYYSQIRGQEAAIRYVAQEKGLSVTPEEAWSIARKQIWRENEIIARPVDKRENYIKRCVGIPGDVLEMKDAVLYVNGKKLEDKDKMQYNYDIIVNAPFNKVKLQEMGISMEDINGGYMGNNHYVLPLTVEMVEKIKKMLNVLSVNHQEDDAEKITLMTIHSAKGLEFKNVFVVGMEENLFPSALSLNSYKELEEERRLFYVAITRAEEHCYLSFAKSRFKYGKMEFSSPSRFLKDIDVHFLKLPQEEQMARRIDERASRFCREQNERAARSLFDEPASQSSYGRSSSNISGGQKTFLVGERPKVEIIRPSIPRNLTKVGPETVSKPSAARNLSVNVQAGQVIEHERFGIGDVIKVEGIGENSKATVRFRNAGEKQLLLKFARFKVVE